MSLEEDIIAQIKYNESCDYNSSTHTTLLETTEQDIIIKLTITNLNTTPLPANSKRHHLDEIYFNDILEIKANVITTNLNPIKIGMIQFYFFDEYTKEITILGNTLINNDGLAGVKHIPHHNGYYYAQYINTEDTKYYEEIYSDNYPITLQNIPTDTFFDKPNRTHIQEAVDLIAHVEDIDGNPLDYGTVTFLTYKVHAFDGKNAGVERVIGDPVPLDSNGTAKLSYSPRQNYAIDYVFYDTTTGDLWHTYKNKEDKFLKYENTQLYLMVNGIAKKYSIDDTDGTKDIKLIYQPNEEDVSITEYLKAHYNFGTALYNPNPSIYGNQFKYYKDSNAYQELILIQKNTLQIQISEVKYINNRPTLQDVILNEDLSYDINFSTILVVEATVYDINGNKSQVFPDNTEVTFYIEHEDSVTETKGVFTKEGTITIDGNNIKTKTDHSFVQTIEGWNGGYHTIYAKIDSPITDDLTSNTILVYCSQGDDTIKLQSPIYNNQSINNSFLTTDKITISSQLELQNTPLKYFDGQEITFIEHCTTSTKENVVYKAKIKNGIASFTWSPSEAGDYYFTAGIENVKIKNIQYYGITSKESYVKVRDKIECDITYDIIPRAPGIIFGNISVKNIFKTEQPQIYFQILKTTNNISNTIYKDVYYNANFDFNQTDLDHGDYILQIIVNNETIKSVNFTINKGILESEIIEPINNSPTTLLQNIIIKISPKIYDNEIKLLNNNIIKIKKYEITNNVKILLDDVEYTPEINTFTDGSVQLTTRASLPKEKTYKIGFQYTDTNGNYNTIKQTFDITTTTIPAQIKKTEDIAIDNKIKFQIVSKNTQIPNNEYCLVETSVTVNNIIYNYLTITDIYGQGAIQFNGDSLGWQNRDKTKTISTPIPNINSILNTLKVTSEEKQLSTLENILLELKVTSGYNYANIYIGDTCVDLSQSTLKEQYLLGLLEQIRQTEYTAFFTTYNQTSSYMEE